jgi:hypothetical protein
MFRLENRQHLIPHLTSHCASQTHWSLLTPLFQTTQLNAFPGEDGRERLSPDLTPIMTEHREASMFGLCMIRARIRLQDKDRVILVRPTRIQISVLSTAFKPCDSTSLAPRTFVLRAMTVTIHFHLTPGLRKRGIIRGSFHKFCTLYVFSLKMNFILQNTFTGLQCNLHCALSQRSNVWESLVFLSGRLRCWCVW